MLASCVCVCVCVPDRPSVVSVLWLLACCSTGERVSEDQYLCLDLDSLGGESTESVRVGGRSDDGGGGRRKRRLGDEEERGAGGGESRSESAGKRRRVAEPTVEDEDEDDETQLDEEALIQQYQNGIYNNLLSETTHRVRVCFHPQLNFLEQLRNRDTLRDSKMEF